MKTILEQPTRDELVSRINQLQENSTAKWGQMNVRQMMRHCILWEEMALGQKKYPRVFLGRILGRFILKAVLKDDAPMRRNSPTIAPMKINTSVGDDVASQKKKWIALLEEHRPGMPDIVHPIFGKMTAAEVGLLLYKHTDHHLRQFNV
ncbi:DinB family protein [Chitinophaga dinghuensis]|nr:DinB family protein [Chitinophaga dinghuensis]